MIFICPVFDFFRPLLARLYPLKLYEYGILPAIFPQIQFQIVAPLSQDFIVYFD